MELGQELLPLTAAQWARWLFACVAMTFAGLVLAWRNRRNGSVMLSFAISALLFGILTVKSAKFEEYFVPLSVVALALATRSIKWRFLLPTIIFATLLYTAIPLSETFKGLGSREEKIPASLASSLQQQIPAGAQVFTTDWEHTGTCMLALPDRRFIVALDPSFFYANKPELYELWYNLPLKAPSDAAEIIRKRFGARYVLSYWDVRFSRFYHRLSADPSVRTLLVSDYWMLFDLGG